jgi:hypothetical protein
VVPRLAWRPFAGGRHLRADCPFCGRYLAWVPQSAEAVAEVTRQAQAGPPAPAAPRSPQSASRPAFDAAAWPEDVTRGVIEAVEVLPRGGEVVAQVPGVADLLAEARASAPSTWSRVCFCANLAFYGSGGRPGLLPRLRLLVGPESGCPGLPGTAAALEAAGRALYAALPPCGHRCVCSTAGVPPWLLVDN